MGRTVLADDGVKKYIEELIQSKQWYIGLILGQLSAQKDFVLHLARTPDLAEDQVCEESEVLGNEERLPSSKKKAKQKPKSLEFVDEQWVATHAKQVTRMLPGGLDVIGVFAVAPPDMLKSTQNLLRQILFTVHKTVTKNLPLLGEDITDRILFQVDSLTSKTVCQSIDVADQKNAFRPAEWRYSSSTQWLQLESAAAIDVCLYLTSQSMSLSKLIQWCVTPFCQNIWECAVMINGEVRDESEPLSKVPEGKRGKGKEVPPPPQSFRVDFLLPLQGSEEDVNAPKVTPVTKMVVVKGIIVCRAFVHWKATVREAVQAIKNDFIRSLYARCELLCEDLELTDEISALATRIMYDTPVRGFINLDCGAQFCDYKFQDEKPEEMRERIRELLEVNVSEEALDLAWEHPARDNDWVTVSHSEHNLADFQDQEESKAKSRSTKISVFGMMAGGVLGAAAAAISYVVLENR